MARAQATERVKTGVAWTPALLAALDRTVAAYTQRDRQRFPPVSWDRGTVSEDILRQALGVGESE